MNIYLTGGTVRDKLLGLSASKDLDFSVEAQSYAKMREHIVKVLGAKIHIEKPEYLTIRAGILRNRLADYGGFISASCPTNEERATLNADFVLCRKDGTYSDKRRPDEVKPGTLYDDLRRRDFTMNALAVTPEGDLIDPFDGQKDMKARMIVCVGSPEERFKEDNLRALRALRFSVTKTMGLHRSVENAIRIMSLTNQLGGTSPDRIREELYKMFSFDTVESLRILAYYPSLCKTMFVGTGVWLKPTTETR